MYAVLPMFHAYSLCLTFAMSMGDRLVLFPKFDPELVLEVAKKHPVTFLPLVPPIAERLRAANEKGVSLSGTEIAIFRGDGAAPRARGAVQSRLGRYLVEGYGLSECSPILMANPVAENRVPGTVGLPLPGAECRMVDPDAHARRRARRGRRTHRPRAAGVLGLLRQAGEDRGGLRGRVVPHRRHSGEEVVAAIVVDGGKDVDDEDIRAFVRGILTPYKVPRRIFVVDELPTSLIGKVPRRQVRERLLALTSGS